VQQTKFYSTPKAGLDVLTGNDLQAIMKKVVDFCVSHEITATAPKVGYGTKAETGGVALRFDPSYIKLASEKMK